MPRRDDLVALPVNDQRRRRHIAQLGEALELIDGQKRRTRMIEQRLIPGSTRSTGLVLPHDFDFPEKAHTGALKDSFIKKHRP